MTVKEIVSKALKYGIPGAAALLAGSWLWVTMARIATGNPS
jgi:hypothetical protein